MTIPTTEQPVNGSPAWELASPRGPEASDRTGSTAAAEQSDVEAARREVAQKWDIKAAKAAARSAGKRKLAHTRLDDIESGERVDFRKALRQKRKITDPAKHLVSTYRQYRFIRRVLMVGTLCGIAWTSWNVATSLGGPNPFPLYYVAEPIISVPVACIVYMQVIAAMNGRLARLRPFTRRPGGYFYWPTITGLIEIGLLATSVVICVYPALAVPQPQFEHVATRAIGPLAVVVFVALQLVAAELFGEIIREARLSDDEESDDTSLRDRVRRAVELARDVERAMTHPTSPIPVQADGLPSVSTIAKRFPGNAKQIIQIAHDLLEHRKGGE